MKHIKVLQPQFHYSTSKLFKLCHHHIELLEYNNFWEYFTCDKWNALIRHNTYDFITTSYTPFLEDIQVKGYNTKGIPMFPLHESE